MQQAISFNAQLVQQTQQSPLETYHVCQLQLLTALQHVWCLTWSQYMPSTHAGKFLLAICEGNFCKGGRQGEEEGNGRIIVSQLQVNESDPADCRSAQSPSGCK